MKSVNNSREQSRERKQRQAGTVRCMSIAGPAAADLIDDEHYKQDGREERNCRALCVHEQSEGRQQQGLSGARQPASLQL